MANASYDKFILELVKNKDYRFYKNGKIKKKFKKKGMNQKNKINNVYKGTSSSGYHVITYKGRKLCVHRIIYCYFFKNINQRMVINHKNHIKTDNRLINLEMITEEENSSKTFLKLKNKSSTIGMSKANKIRKERSKGKTIKQLSLKFNLPKYTIQRIVSNKTWSLNKTKQIKQKKIPTSVALEHLIKNKNYKILKSGNVFSKKNKKLLSILIKKKCNYASISYKGTSLFIHRVIARKFLGKIPKNLVVNHKDGNFRNNKLSNLEIVTQKQNMIHNAQILKRCEGPVFSKKDLSIIIKKYKKGFTINYISNLFKIHHSVVKKAIKNLR